MTTLRTTLHLAWILIGSLLATTIQAQPPAAQDETLIISLKHVELETAQQIVDSLFTDQGSLRLTAEPRSNSLILRGTKAELEQIADFLADLDKRAASATKSGSTALLTNDAMINVASGPDRQTLETLRAEYQTLEAQCHKLAEDIRSAKDNTDTSKESLTKLVERVFEVRQQLQRAELAASAQRLAKIQQTIESRQALKAQIVQRRVSELLKPGVTQMNKKPEPRRATENNLRATDNSSSALAGTADVLRLAPHEMRKLLHDKSRELTRRKEELEKLRSEPVSQTDENKRKLLNDNLQLSAAALRDCQLEFEFAKLQYSEALRYLESSASNLKQQLDTAQKEYERAQKLHSKGLVSESEVSAASVRPRELQLGLERVDSLLKLYRATADDIPDLKNERGLTRAASRLSVIPDKKLGTPKWLSGNCGLTSTPFQVQITANAVAGQFARVMMEKIAGQAETAKLLLKFDVPTSLDERVDTDRGFPIAITIDAKYSTEEIQAALDGKPVKKRYVLGSDLTVSEKATEEANDLVVATLELCLPETKAP